MNRNHLALIDFVLETAPAAAVHRRIAIYRGLADLCGDATESRELTSLADDLEKAELRCSEFVFRFQQKKGLS